MNDPAGKLLIRVGFNGAEILSMRPVHAAGIFAGRGVDETVRLLPALFSICSTAQAAACTGALEQAMGYAAVPRIDALRSRLVDAETLREHLWRILLDWPKGIGEPSDGPAMAQVMAGFGALKQALTLGGSPFDLGAGTVAPDRSAARRAESDLVALVARRVLGESPDGWISRVTNLDALLDWARGADTVAARLVTKIMDGLFADLGRSDILALPALDVVRLEGHLAGEGADAFVARPDWSGSPRETSPYSRHLDTPLVRDLTERFGNGLLPRLGAQLLEVAALAMGEHGAVAQLVRMPASAGSTPGVGLAQVQAARGLLVHRVQVSDDRVTDYRILAPTEWNFHPRGAVAVGLSGMALSLERKALEPLARLFITAVDPCVDFTIEFN